MSACQKVRKWITEEIRQPFEQFISNAEESCTEARRWVEREVRKPIERRRTRTEKKCKKRKCKWYCLCCNKWFCWLETIIERIIEWVIEIVGEWLVETICKIIVKIIKIIIEVVISVVRLVVVGLTCLFTNPKGALDALIDFWYDLVDIVEDVGDLIGDVLDAASDLLDLTKEFILDLSDRFGAIGRFFGGIIAGILDIGRRIIDGAGRIVEGIFDIIEGILHLDFCAALEGLVNGLGFGAGQVVFGATGIISLAANGARDGIVRNELRNWLQKTLEDRFSGEELENAERVFGMPSSSFGVDWPVYPFICNISSRSSLIDLRELHHKKAINLYKVGGYAPFGCKDTPVVRSAFELVYSGTEYRVSLGDIRSYLENGPNSVPDFVLAAGSKRIFKDMVRVATIKMRQMAINLQSRPVMTVEITATERILGSVTPLAERITSENGLSDICDLPSGMVFGYSPQHFGLSSPFWLGEDRTTTAATVRSSFMVHLFGTVLAHEMGHCFSLRHDGHDGMEHIMFTMDESADLESVTSGTVIEYILMGGEPRFTLQNGKDAWTWILTEATECVL